MYTNPFKDFKFTKEEIEKVASVADEHRVKISIRSDYMWGEGWSSMDAKNKFQNTVYFALENNGYDLDRTESRKTSGVCPYLKAKDRFENSITHKIISGNKLCLYLHPMEFSGYANERDLDRIINILTTECSDVIKKIEITENIQVYDLDDTAYERLILKRSKDIADCIKEAVNNGYKPFDEGFNFVKTSRVPRYGEVESCLSSSDIDIRTVNNIIEIAEKLGYFEKDLELTEDNDKDSDIDL